MFLLCQEKVIENMKEKLAKELLFTLFILIMIGCDKDSNMEREFYPSGELKAEATFKNGVQHGDYRIYYENGKLEEKGRYENGKLVDTVYSYYPSGVLEMKSPKLDSLIRVVTTAYYPSGKLKSKVNIVIDIKRGEGYLYYEENEILKAYLYYAENEEVTYRRDYDELGNLIKEKGVLFPEGVWINGVEFKVGETFEATMLAIAPPGCTIKVFVGEYDIENGILKNREEVIQSDDGFYKYSRKFNKIGVYNWGAYVELDCETQLSEQQRTQQVEITIRE